MRASRSVRIVLASSFLFVSSAVAQAYSGIAVFGDSLSDVGNVPAWTSGNYPAANKYWNGRWSNGRTWVEYLGDKLGLNASTSSFSRSNPNFATGGMNYATGGAHVDTSNPQLEAWPFGFGSWGIRQQINYHNFSATPDANRLYVLWGGGNDILDGDENVWQMATQMLDNVAQLYVYSNARTFLVPNLPSLGEIPRFATQADVDHYNQLTTMYNFSLDYFMNVMKQWVPDVNIIRLDVNGIFNDVLAHPAQYGIINTTDQGYNKTNGGQYLFWDDLHPTTMMHQIVANKAYELLVSGGATLAAVPEPATAGLLAIGALTLRRKRRAA